MLELVPRALSLTYITVLGACLGSFANVVIARLPEGESIVKPRSRCPTCKHAIAWYDNVPLVSWLVLRARCRSCGARISPRYFLVELMMAGLAAALWMRFGWSLELLLWIPLATALIVVVFLDIDHWWVPDVITIPAMVVVALASFVPGGLTPLEALLGLGPALLIWGVAWVFERVTGNEGLGFGDVKLLAVIGLALGISAGLGVLVLAAVQGAIVGVVVLLTGGHKGVVDATAVAAQGGGGSEGVADASAAAATAEKPPEQRTAPGTEEDPPAVRQQAADAPVREGDNEEDAWVPHPHAIPFGPFIVLATLEVVLLPSLFGDLPRRVSDLVLRWLV